MGAQPDFADDPIVYVPVPRTLLGPVYAMLANLLAGDDGPAASADAGGREYTEDEMRCIKAEVSSPTVIALLNLTAQRAGEWVPYPEILAVAGVGNYRAGNAQLRAFTRFIKKRLQRDEWPFEYAWPEGPGRVHYRMNETNASRWRNA